MRGDYFRIIGAFFAFLEVLLTVVDSELGSFCLWALADSKLALRIYEPSLKTGLV
jgi:hypothetical protein